MSDEQPTSWRERFFGSPPAETPASEESAAARDEQTAERSASTHDSAQVAPDEAEVASTSVEEHDDHQPLVEHEMHTDRPGTDDTDTAVLDAQTASDDRSSDSPIEPTVIAPSTLRGPSHSAAHPDDAARSIAHDAHGEAAESSLSQHPEADGQPEASAPPALVEPRRPSFGLRRRAEGDATDAALADDQHDDAGESDGGGSAGLAAGGAAAAGAAGLAASTRRTEREFVEPEPTQAMDAQRGPDDDATRAMDARDAPGAGDTRVLETQEAEPEQRTQRFGIIRDEVPASSIPVDDETARAAAGGGTPIVLVEEPMPPRRKGARGVGFAVALLATLIFAIVFAAAFFAVGYLFDRQFDATETLQTLWLRPSYLLPVVIFFLAYWIVTLLVNRAGWWAHVLGAFIVALLVYAAHIGGAFMEQQGGWGAYTALPGIDPQALGQLLLAPLSVLAFVIAREVPVWVGGIVARRGRKARDWNRQAMDDFNAENAERLAAYERARG